MITSKKLRNAIKNLDALIEEYKIITSSKKRDWKEYESKYNERILCAMREFSPLLDNVISNLKFTKRICAGRKRNSQ